MAGHPRSPTSRPRRPGAMPRAIVLHTTAGSWDSALGWLTDPRSGVSAHWLVGTDGATVPLVDERLAARHAGVLREPTAELLAGGDPNDWTIGIELVDDAEPDAPRTPAQLHAARRLLRGIAGRWGIPLDRRHVLGHRELRADKTCPGAGLDLDALVASAARPTQVVALLPVRNGADHLADWLAAVRPLADQVLALDDGSTDATPELLAAAAPFVEVIASNAPRASAAGWHDLANRQRLVDAAAERHADWVVFLDADERLAPSDAAALKAFLRSADALDGCAYGLRHHRAWADGHDPAWQLVVRVFAPRPGDALPTERLHRVPVPDRIPEGAWLPTTIPLLHLGAIDHAGTAAHRAKYAQADPEGEFPFGFGGLHEAPPTVVPGLPLRRASDPVLALPGFAFADRPAAAPAPVAGGETDDAEPGRPLLAVLLPVRNGAAHLRDWLDGAAPHADLIAVLDDGSTDATHELIADDPRIDLRLRNAPRPTAAGWDDAANRQRLLELVGPHAPRWILFLDADERLDAADWTALTAALDDDQLDPGTVYQLRVCRMIGDAGQYDRAGLWVDRLFAWQPGLHLPAGRLHAPPAPADRPRAATTLRIQHLASRSAAERAARVAKYDEADPDRAHQADYSALLDAPGALRTFEPRPPGLPVVALDGGAGLGALDPHALDLDAPALSAIVIARDDEDWIEAAVGAVTAQEVDRPFEVIVVVSGSDRTAEIVRERFPRVRLVELGAGEALPGRARNAGLQLARGDYVSFPGSHVVLPPGSLQARLDAHEAGHAMVTGSFRNANATHAGWASHLIDHAASLPGRPSGELAGPPGSCSYARDLLLDLGGFPEHLRAGEDTAVNVALYDAGHRAWRSQDIVLTYRARARTPRALFAHHLRRGRALGRLTRAAGARAVGVPEASLRGWIAGLRTAPSTVLRPADRIARIAEGVELWGDEETRAAHATVERLVLLGARAAWLGAWLELLTPLRRGGEPPS